jgi:hypothetical protein
MNFLPAWYWIIPLGLALVGAAFFCWRWIQKHRPEVQLQRARDLFQQERPRLETLFFQAASASGKPRGLRWQECQWDSSIEWVRDKQTGQLLTLVGVTIAFEAIEGGDMEGVEAVGNLRSASAVFFFQEGRWQTAGRAIFNLSPADAVQHFSQNYTRIA